jgi:alkylated DNA nucleotide flippase Atl1
LSEHTPFARAVLDAVDEIPRGKVMSYGDVADYVGRGSARGVGAVMSQWGHEVAWHRVVMADGRPAPGHEREQLARLRKDKTPLRGHRVDMSRARWDGRVKH